MRIFHDLGTRPVVNACGIYTDLGGAILSPTVWAAMTEANASHVDMVELLASSGAIVAGLLDTEAARVTPGASAAISLATAACMTGGDGAALQRLPDTNGLRSRVLIQRGHRYKYGRIVRLTGAKVIPVGDRDGVTSERAIEAALDPDRVAALLFPAHLDRAAGTLGLRRTAELAHARGIPVIVDAAYLNDPPATMSSFRAAGADLVCFSAKYFHGPNSGGIVAGRSDLVAAVANADFTGFESGQWLIFGRAYKLDRHTVVGVVVALREWLAMDHGARRAADAARVERLAAGLSGLTGIELARRCFTMQETYADVPVNCLYLRLVEGAAVGPMALVAGLRDGDPSIRVIEEPDGIAIVVDTLRDADVDLVTERIRERLG